MEKNVKVMDYVYDHHIHTQERTQRAYTHTLLKIIKGANDVFQVAHETLLMNSRVSHRHYCNICQVQRPINSNTSGQDCSIHLQHSEKASNFETTRFSIQLIPCLLKWIR